MGFFTDLFGGPGETREIGGGFDPAIKPFVEPSLSEMQTRAGTARDVLSQQRVAGFTDPQLQAQQALLGLSGVSGAPKYQDTLESLEESLGMIRQASRPLTAEDISLQRELLQGTADAERLALQRGFQQSLRDIGVGAGGAGVGALTGARADILRGGAAGELAGGLAGIESRLSERALSGAQAQQERGMAGASAIERLAGTRLGVEQEEFQEATERARLAEQVGAQQRGLEQERIAEERRAAIDPFRFTQEELSTYYGAPTRQTQYSQDPSTFQEVMGIATGFFDQGGVVNRNAGGLAVLAEAIAGGSAEMAMSGEAASEGGSSGGDLMGNIGYGSGDPAQEMQKYASKQLSTGGTPQQGGFLSKLKEKAKDKFENNIFTDDKGLSSVYMDKNKKKTADDAKESESTKSRMSSAEAMAAGAPTTFKVDDSVMFAKQRAARQGIGTRYKAGGGISYLEAGGVPGPMEDQNQGTFNRILSGVGGGLQSLGRFYKTKVDPFRDYSESERRRIGMAILGTQPTLGESPLTTVFRGASPAVTAIEAERAAAEEREIDRILAEARKKSARASLLKAQKEDDVDVFEQKPAAVNALRQAAATKFGFVFDMDTGEFTDNGNPLTKSQADRLTDVFNLAVQKYKETEGDLAASINLIAQQ